MTIDTTPCPFCHEGRTAEIVDNGRTIARICRACRGSGLALDCKEWEIEDAIKHEVETIESCNEEIAYYGPVSAGDPGDYPWVDGRSFGLGTDVAHEAGRIADHNRKCLMGARFNLNRLRRAQRALNRYNRTHPGE